MFWRGVLFFYLLLLLSVNANMKITVFLYLQIDEKNEKDYNMHC